MITDPLFYAPAIPAILITGISKTGFGGAMGGLAVPLLSLVIPPDEAAGIMLPILCTMDVIGLRRFAGSFDWPNLRIILPGAVVGIVLGTLCFGLPNKGWLLLLVGAIGVGFPLLNWSGLARRQHPAGVSAMKGGFWSALSGFTSFICHNRGVPLPVYLMSQQLERKCFVGTTIMFFLAVIYVKLILYNFLGQLRPRICSLLSCCCRRLRSASTSACGCSTASRMPWYIAGPTSCCSSPDGNLSGTAFRCLSRTVCRTPELSALVGCPQQANAPERGGSRSNLSHR
ncbi:MAG: sulfite exporter TauE/SafE family protein [Betaproteobacteria bacterium]|jgi:uncharacterized membrane protein YfcA